MRKFRTSGVYEQLGGIANPVPKRIDVVSALLRSVEMIAARSSIACSDGRRRETFFVNVTSITGAGGLDVQGEGTIIDDDIAGVVISPTSGLITTEAGGTATFTVVLATEPTADVTVDVASDDPTEGSVAPAQLVFSPTNWSVPQTVTVTGVDDAIVDGQVAYDIITSLSSPDTTYAAIDPADVAVSNAENGDAAGIFIAPTRLTTTEAGGTATFSVFLSSEPTADVVFDVTSDDPSEGTATPTSLTFTALDWNVPQAVTVTGADDDEVDGPIGYEIVLVQTTTDPLYAALDVPDVRVTNADDDVLATTTTTTTTPSTTAPTTAPTTSTVVATTSAPISAPPTPPTTVPRVDDLPATGGSPLGNLALASMLFIAGVLTLGYARLRTRRG